MSQHDDYTVEELVLNSSFRRWVLDHDLSEEPFWLLWMGSDPDRSHKINEAKWLITVLKEKDFMTLSDEDLKQDITELMNTIKIREMKNHQSRISHRWWWGAAAASVVLILGFIAYWSQTPSISTKEFSLSKNNDHLIHYSNTTQEPLKFYLPDSSLITLEPFAEVTYGNNMENERRVELVGGALFEVKKDPRKPFIVLSNQVITRVLGTKFKVNSNLGVGVMHVEVISGKVSVFKKQDWEKSEKDVQKLASGVVLTANQSVDYTIIDGTFRKKIIDMPGKIKEVKKEDFEFVMTPVNEVFDRIQASYGVEIVYDTTLLANCKLNASLSEENMYEKIKLICQSIGATYHEIDARIIINAQKGCE